MKKSFTIPIYNQPIVFTDNIEDAKKHCKPKDREDVEWFEMSEVDSAGFTLVDKDCKIVICIQDPNDVGNLVHEITHATIFTLLSRDVGVTLEQNEAFCYLNGYLMEKWMELMW